MTKEAKFKPTYIDFLIYRLTFINRPPVEDNSSYKYIENKTTKLINRLFYLLSWILYPRLVFFTCGKDIFYFMLMHSIFATSIVICIESIHWFYAKFDLIDKVGTEGNEER